MNRICWAWGVSLLAIATSMVQADDKIKTLIVDGQNNHKWQETTPILKWILESTGRFDVAVSSSPPSAPRQPKAPAANANEKQKADYQAAMKKWQEEKKAIEESSKEAWSKWRPKFSDYAVVVSNYNGQSWPDEVKSDFVAYIQNGGGFVPVHAANNAFADWPEYNLMIGLGGWGGRNEKSGPYLRYREGKIVRDTTPGPGGHHGPQHEFAVDTRDPDHPIMKGLPATWMHAKDELYDKLRGPAENVAVLATAYSSPAQGGTGEHEPMLMALTYGKGRVFHTALGHESYSMADRGFQITFVRGTEWAATGAVTAPSPSAEELSADKPVLREPPK